jgi:hypothetical protein
MALQDDYVDPRTLADLGSAQQKVQRPGLDFPIAQFTAGMMTNAGDPAHKQLDRQARSADSAATLGLNREKFKYDQEQDKIKNLIADRKETRENAKGAMGFAEHLNRT